MMFLICFTKIQKLFNRTIRGDIFFNIYNMRKCKWCDKELVDKRIDAAFCRRICKGMYRRAEKNKRIKNESL